MNISDKFLQSKEFDLCLRSSSSPECGTFLLCCRDMYPQCKLCRRPEIRQVQFLEFVDAPVVVQRRCYGSDSAETVLVPQLQFIDVGSIRCDHAAPSSNSFPYAVQSGFFAFIKGIFRTPSIWTLSPGFQRTFWGAVHMNPRKQECRICAAPRKERTSHNVTNRKNGAKQWSTKHDNQTKNTTNELWNLFEAE